MTAEVYRRLPVFSSFIKTLLDDTTATAALATLGIGPTGNYTPVLTHVANVAASTAYDAPYYRISSIVAIWGYVDIDPTAATTLTQLGMTIPVASNFAGTTYAGGIFSATGTHQGGGIFADAANDRLTLSFYPASATNVQYRFLLVYLVV